MLLGRAYFQEIASRLLLVLAGVVFLIGIGASIRASSTSQGAPLGIALSLVPLIIGQALPYFIPVALMTAVVVTYGRMAGDGEAVACFTSGKRPLSLLGAAMGAALLVGGMSYPFASEVVPDLYRSMRELRARVPLAALENINPGASELHFGGLHLSWNGRRPDGAMQEVLLAWSTGRGEGEEDAAEPTADPESEPLVVPVIEPTVGPVSVDPDGVVRPMAQGRSEFRLRADAGRMRVQNGVLVFAFEQVRWVPGGEHNGEIQLEVPIADLQDERTPRQKAKDMTTSDIRAALAVGLETEEQTDSHRYVMWQRRATALASLPLALIGALLGWRLRRGGFLAALAASLGMLLMVFYPAYFLAEGMHKAGTLDPVVAAWVPISVLVPVAAVLLWRAGRAH